MPTETLPEPKNFFEAFNNLFAAILLFISECELSVTEARQAVDDGYFHAQVHHSLSRRLLRIASSRRLATADQSDRAAVELPGYAVDITADAATGSFDTSSGLSRPPLPGIAGPAAGTDAASSSHLRPQEMMVQPRPHSHSHSHSMAPGGPVGAQRQAPRHPSDTTTTASSEATPETFTIHVTEKGQPPSSSSDNATPPQPSSPPASQPSPSNPFASNLTNGVTYMSLTWWRAGILMVAETISLGILALPASLATLGLIPGLLLLVIFGALATYTGIVIGQLRLRHEHIHSMAEAGEMLLGIWGREGVMAGQILFVLFIMGAHLIGFGKAVAALLGPEREGLVCGVVLLFVGFLLSIGLTVPRTLRHMSYYCVVSFVSIVGAVVVTMVAVGVESQAVEASRIGGMEVRLWPREDLGFAEACNAVCSIVFAYAAHVAFFTFISELKDPRDFPKALAFLQVSDVSLYILAAVVIYIFAGEDVKTPALDSAGEVWRKAAYGVALPTIIVAGVINGHICTKWIYVQWLRDNDEDLMHQRTWKARAIWIGIAFVSWLIAWIISETVPVFGDIVGLTGALFASWFTFGLQGAFWLMMNYRRDERRWWRVRRRGNWRMGWRKAFLTGLNIVNIVIAAVIFVAGTVSSGLMISEHAKNAGKPFSCRIR